MGNDVRGGKHSVKNHPEDGSMDEVLQVRDDRNVVRDSIRAVTVDGHYRLAVIGEPIKDTADQYNWTREHIEIFVAMGSDGTALYTTEIMNNIKFLNNVSSKNCPAFHF